MSRAVKIFQGRFGRVALLDMNASLVAHAHHHCHILIKAGGSDSAFFVRDHKQALTDETAVLVNAWEPHAYTHEPSVGGQTLILALYIEPSWLSEIQQSLALSAHPRFFPQTCVHIKPATRKIVEEFVLELWWAERVGFEPTVTCATPDFESGTFGHSATSPRSRFYQADNTVSPPM